MPSPPERGRQEVPGSLRSLGSRTARTTQHRAKGDDERPAWHRAQHGSASLQHGRGCDRRRPDVLYRRRRDDPRHRHRRRGQHRWFCRVQALPGPDQGEGRTGHRRARAPVDPHRHGGQRLATHPPRRRYPGRRHPGGCHLGGHPPGRRRDSRGPPASDGNGNGTATGTGTARATPRPTGNRPSRTAPGWAQPTQAEPGWGPDPTRQDLGPDRGYGTDPTRQDAGRPAPSTAPCGRATEAWSMALTATAPPCWLG